MAELLTRPTALETAYVRAKNASRTHRTRRIKGYELLGFACMADFLAIAVSGFGGIPIIKHVYPQISASQYAAVWCSIAISSIFFFVGLGCYRKIPQDFRAQLPALFAGFSFPILLITFILFVLKAGGDYSRGWILGSWVVGLVGLTIDRVVLEQVRRGLVARHHLTERYAIFGASENARSMIESLKRQSVIEIVGIYDDRRSRIPNEIGGIPISGGINELVAAAESGEIDRIVIALPITALERIRGIVRMLYALPLTINIGIDACQGEIDFRRANRVADSLLLELFDRPLGEWRYFVKACEDFVLAALLVVLAGPLLAMVALAVKLDSPGPVLFRQKRHGFGGKVFEAWKFRTMHHAQRDALGAQLTRRNDPRITRVGRILRQTSLDELPQLFNVLRGEMSLVGPRPHPLAAKAADIPYADAIRHYGLRHRVKPGITGWAQVNGWRGETETLLQLEKRVEYDLFYIEHWSLWLDLVIIARTVLCIFNIDRRAF